MEYLAHYERLVERARKRALVGYSERHHVIPRCLGGSEEAANIVRLTPEEHYVAHQLLVRIHPEEKRLIHAAVWMAKRCSGNKAFGWLRRRNAAVARERSSRLFGESENNPFFGKRHTASSLEKITDAARKRGPEWRAKLSIAAKARKASEETRAKLSLVHRGRGHSGWKHSAETKERISQIHRGMKRSAETRARISAGLLRWFSTSPGIFTGRRHSEETRARMSAAQKESIARRKLAKARAR
jgi:hypothetical protein